MKRLNASSLLLLAAVLVCTANTAAADGVRPGTADRHKEYGVECAGCHGDKDKKLFDYKLCLVCHESYQKLAERTKKLERNPHKSHYEDLECNLCHLGHKADENYCSTCHPD